MSNLPALFRDSDLRPSFVIIFKASGLFDHGHQSLRSEFSGGQGCLVHRDSAGAFHVCEAYPHCHHPCRARPDAPSAFSKGIVSRVLLLRSTCVEPNFPAGHIDEGLPAQCFTGARAGTGECAAGTFEHDVTMSAKGLQHFPCACPGNSSWLQAL